MEKDKTLEKIRESIEDAIKPILKKGEAMSPADLDNLTKAVCVIEKIKRIEENNTPEDDGYSMRSYGYSGNNSYDEPANIYRHERNSYAIRYANQGTMPYRDGGSYHDGGNSMRSHDGVPNARRYYDGGSGNSGYSGHSIQDRMIDQLEHMIDEAKTEHERQTVKDWIRRLKA